MSCNHWDDVKLGDIVTLKQGFAVNSKSNHYVVEKGIPLLKISDLFNGTETMFVKESIPKQFLVYEDEIIYSRTGNSVGHAFMGRKGVVYNNCFKVIPGDRVDSKFLYQLLNTNEVNSMAQSLATGTAQPDLNHGAFKSIKIKLPPLSTQKKIAKILSNYDDLIENNLKQIKLLEEKARLTYEDWFLRFRVDGQKLEIDEGTGLPIGWKEVCLTDYISLDRGVEPGSKAYEEILTNDNIPFIRVGDLNKRESKIYINKELAKGKTCDIDNILISFDGSPGLVKYGLKGCYSSGVRKAVAKESRIGNMFIYNLFSSQYMQGLIDNHATGATILHASSAIKYMKFNLPSDKILEKYNEFSEKEFQILLNKLKENQLLKESRDILLPRLMTGMIDVEKLNVEV